MAAGTIPPGMTRLRKADRSPGGCSVDGITYDEDEDGCVVVPELAAGILCEAHGFEGVPETLGSTGPGQGQGPGGEGPPGQGQGLAADARRGPGRPRGT